MTFPSLISQSPEIIPLSRLTIIPSSWWTLTRSSAHFWSSMVLYESQLTALSSQYRSKRNASSSSRSQGFPSVTRSVAACSSVEKRQRTCTMTHSATTTSWECLTDSQWPAESGYHPCSQKFRKPLKKTRPWNSISRFQYRTRVARRSSHNLSEERSQRLFMTEIHCKWRSRKASPSKLQVPGRNPSSIAYSMSKAC